MSSKLYKDLFSIEELRNEFETNLLLSPSVGIDGINISNFCKNSENSYTIINQKISDGSYKFTKYKSKLISKGKNKPPREISIPTLRDKLVLKVISKYLQYFLKDKLTQLPPQLLIKKIKKTYEAKKYNTVIKLDIKNFYPSISHDTLLKILLENNIDSKAIKLITKAIRNSTVSKSCKSDEPNSIGVPQGLSISNILASIYLLNIDEKYNSCSNIFYFRFVDDILVFCQQKESDAIYKRIVDDFSKINLKIHVIGEVNSKSYITNISSPLDYLGYSFHDGEISVRNESIEKLRNSLISTITSYKYASKEKKNLLFLQWRLNLRITGCIHQNTRRGWLFYFSELNNERLLHQLDYFVTKILKKEGIQLKPKKFSRCFYEINFNAYNSNYFPNFDTYTIEKKKETLLKIFNVEGVDRMTNNEINTRFNKRVLKESKELLKDLHDNNYMT